MSRIRDPHQQPRKNRTTRIFSALSAGLYRLDDQQILKDNPGTHFFFAADGIRLRNLGRRPHGQTG